MTGDLRLYSGTNQDLLLGRWFMVFHRILFMGQVVQEDCLTPEMKAPWSFQTWDTNHSPSNTVSHHRRLEFIARWYFQDQARASWNHDEYIIFSVIYKKHYCIPTLLVSIACYKHNMPKIKLPLSLQWRHTGRAEL